MAYLRHYLRLRSFLLILAAIPAASGLASVNTLDLVDNCPAGTACSAGGIRGTFAVDGLGAANYTVQIEVPPGTAGMAPKLALQFNSRHGDGRVGVGWSLQGLPFVTRCPATVAQDGVAGAVTYRATDRFCFQGQRLIAVRDKSGSVLVTPAQRSAAYGQDGTTYFTEVDSYRSFTSHGTSGGGPTSFTGYDRHGVTERYGGTDSSRVMVDDVVRTWALDRRLDLNGNDFVVSYLQDAGQWYPSEILYTGHPDRPKSPLRSVRLIYGDRPSDAARILRYQAGHPIETRKLLTRIETRVSTRLAKRYELSHDVGAVTNRVLLQQIDEVGADGVTRLTPTTLRWSDNDGPPFVSSTVAIEGLLTEPHSERRAVDLDGNGRTDLMAFLPGSDNTTIQVYIATLRDDVIGFEPSATSTIRGGLGARRIFGDFDGDGLQDLAVVQPGAAWSTLPVYLSRLEQGAHYFEPHDLPMPVCAGASESPIGEQGSQRLVGDIDGDGRGDVIVFRPGSSDARIYAYLSEIDRDTFRMVCRPLEDPSGLAHQATTLVMTGGLTGSPLVDLAIFPRQGDNGPSPASLRNVYPQGFKAVSSTLPSDAKLGYEKGIGDFNHDGLTDIAAFHPGAGWSTLPVYLSQGDGSFAYVDLPLSGNFNDPDHLRMAADFNGDGRGDLFVYKETLTGLDGALYFSRGDGSFREPLSVVLDGQARRDQVFGDWNGDTLLDVAILQLIPDAALHVFAGGRHSEKLTSIAEGRGRTLTLEYRSLADPTVYERGATALAYPLMHAQSPLFVVSGHTAGDGRGNLAAFRHRYADAASNLLGRGFLGFGTVEVDAVSRGTTRVSSYQLAFPLTGRERSKELVCATNGSNIDPRCQAGLRLHASSDHWLDRPKSIGQTDLPAVRQVVLDSRTESRLHYGEASDTTTVQRTVDNQGNLLRQSTTHSLDPSADLTVESTYRSWPELHVLGKPTLSVARSATATVLRQEARRYDRRANLIARDTYLSTGSSPLFVTSTYEVDAFGNVVATIEPPRGRRTIVYDNVYQTYPVDVTESRPEGRPLLAQHFEHDPRFGTETGFTDYNGNISSWVLDAFGRVNSIRETAPDGSLVETAALQRHQAGLMKVIKRKRMCWDQDIWWTQTLDLDGLGRTYRTETISDDGDDSVVVDKTFDARGYLVRHSLPYFLSQSAPGVTATTYDAYGRVVTVTHPDGREDTTSYLDHERVSRVLASGSDSATRQASCSAYFHDHKRIRRKIFDNGYTIDFDYDAFGQLIAARFVDDQGDPSAPECRPLETTGPALLELGYDVAGHVIRRKTPNNTVTRRYDDRGLVVARQVSDRHGASLVDSTMSHESVLGRLRQETHRSSGLTETVAHTYDLGPAGCNTLGRPVAVAEQEGSFRYTYCYTAQGLPSSETVAIDGVSESWSTRYSATGEWLERTLDGVVLARTLTSAGRTRSQSMGTARLDNDEFDAFGWPGKQRQSAGERFSTETTYSYAPLTGSILGIEVARAGQVVFGQTLDRDLLDRVRSDTTAPSGADIRYSYTGNGQIASATGGSHGDLAFAYGPREDLTDIAGVELTYDEPIERELVVGTSSGARFAYDGLGRVTAKEGTVPNGLRFDYGARGRLGTVATGTTDAVSFRYNHRGERIAKVVDGGASSYYFAPFLERVTLAGSEQRRSAYLQGRQGNRVAMTDGDTWASAKGIPGRGTFFLYQDHLGSTRLVLDAQGNESARVAYRPFGAFTLDGQDNFRAKFTGQEWDDSSELYSFEHRYYDPEVARFLTPDDRLGALRLETFDALKRFTYAGDDPLNHVDPSGHSFLSAIGGLLVSAAEIVAGVALEVVTEGAATPISASLIGAGVSGAVYDVSHFSHFQWSGFGEQEAIGAVGGAISGGVGAAASALVSEAASLGAGAVAQTGISVGMGVVAGGASSFGSQEMGNLLEGKSAANISWLQVAIGAGFGGAGAGLKVGVGRLKNLRMSQLEGLENDVSDLRKNLDTLTRYQSEFKSFAEARKFVQRLAERELSQKTGQIVGLQRSIRAISHAGRFAMPFSLNLNKVLHKEGVY